MQQVMPPTAEKIETTPEALVVHVQGRRLVISWKDCSPRLANATTEQRLKAELSPGGYGIHWPMLDEDLSVPALVKEHASRSA